MRFHPRLTFILLFTGTALLASHSYAQVYGPLPSPFHSFKANTVSVMSAKGDTLWIGPGLNSTLDHTMEWSVPNGADSLVGGRGRVFSLSLSTDTVWAGLGFNRQTPEGSVQTGMGYHLSVDGGQSWSYIPHPLDQPDDSTFTYGGQVYAKLPVSVAEQSPPFAVDHHGDVIISANWASGLVRSRNSGDRWKRLVLPPQDADSLAPENSYTFGPPGDNRYDPRTDQNLLAFGVLIDRDGWVWGGTAGGINISRNALSASADSIRWQHIQVNGSDSGLLGNWIIDIKQQPATGDIWMTNWPAGLHPGETYGIVRTGDKGASFSRYLEGHKINDISFRGSYVIAAGDEGIFISPDNGQRWEFTGQLKSANTFIKASARYLSTAVTTGKIWVGTTDGLAFSDDLGKSWQISRVNFPLAGGNQYLSSPGRVEAYAYPSPYSPSRHGIVRIRFEVSKQGNVKIRLFDFGMNLIREITDETLSPGTYEAVWRGRDRSGKQVANGPVLYHIKTPGNDIRGKLLVID